MSGLRRLLACAGAVAVLGVAAPGPTLASTSTAVGSDSIGSVEKRERARPQSQPADETPPRTPGGAGDGRFSTSRIITAVGLQALLLVSIAGLVHQRRSVRKLGNPVRQDSARIPRGDTGETPSGAGRSRSSPRPLEPVDGQDPTRRTRAPTRAEPERDARSYLCLSLTDGRIVEGSLRGSEANGHVLVVDVDYVVEPDGKRRRGRAADSFVPLSTIEKRQSVEGPRSA